MKRIFRNKTAISFGLMAALLAIVWIYYSVNHPSGSFRYKMTVEVETPEGLKTGSAVREVQMRTGPGLMGVEKRGYARVLGEAVVVDLGNRGDLFALLGEDYAYQIAFDAFGWHSGGLTPEGIKHFRDIKVGKAIIEPGPLRNPILATFKNSKDPKTLQILKSSDLASYFGQGVALKNITIEIVDEPVTHLVDQYIPSFGKETGFIEWFRGLAYGDPRRVGPENFK